MGKYGANLQACRIRAGYNSAREFCEKNHYSIAKYKNYEYDKCRIPLNEAVHLAELLGCTLFDIIGADSISLSDSELLNAYNNAPEHVKLSINFLLREYLN